METPTPSAAPIPQAGQPPLTNNVNISTENESNNTNAMFIFGAIALGLFIVGNMIFTISNYTQLRTLKKQIELTNK